MSNPTPFRPWRSATHEDGADTDDAPEPERRDDDGNVPADADGGPGTPFAEQDIYPLRHPDPARPIIVQMVAPVEIQPAREWAPSSYNIEDVCRRVAEADPARLSITITNRGTADVSIGASESSTAVGAPTAVTIEVDESRTFTHAAEIWAVTATGTTATLELVAERR